MKAEITITDVTAYGVVLKVAQGPSAMIVLLTPQEAYDVIRMIRDGLFKWGKLTKKSIDEGNPS